eukprot:c20119_g1_i1 orf=454-2997(+)
MAKHHPSSSPPPGIGAHTQLSPTSPLSASQLSLQLKQDLAKLTHNDPDTRRSSLEALKGFIEGELDTRSMSGFLEQVSGETGKGSGSCAISLFVEVARVHKQATVPFIPRIMAAVLRTLASSSGGAGHGNNVHQACAKVVAAVTRYAIEPASSTTRLSSSTDVLDSLCQPLLGLLCSNVEPVAVGSATCLQAIVEAENWKLAASELVHDVCSRSSTSLVEKGKHSVAHMHLMRSLAKFNSGALHEYSGSLLKVGIHVLTATSGNASACGSWQQRVAAAQLLGVLLGCLDQGALALELFATTKALECCRLDKNTKVRQAVGEALSIAKSLASQIDPLLLREGELEASVTSSPPTRSRPPESRKRATRKKNLWRTEESCGSTLTMDDIVVGSQESHLASYDSSPSSSIMTASTPLMGSPSPPSTANSVPKTGRSPLYPAKQSPLFPPSSMDRYMTESDLPYILAHMKSSDFKENAPVAAKGGELLLSSKSDDMSHILYNNRNKVTKEDEEVMGTVDKHACTTDFEPEDFLAEECQEMDTLEADSSSERDANTDECGRVSPNSSRNRVCEQYGCGRCECISLAKESEFAKDGSGGPLPNIQWDRNLEEHPDLFAGNCHTSFNGQVNRQEAPRPQATKNSMSAEDFLIFSTPRRLVRSLQSVSSTPDSKCSPERDQGLDLDCETLSESGWSVRDNPIAGDDEEDSPRRASLLGENDTLTKSMEGPFLMNICREGSCATQIDHKKTAHVMNGHMHDGKRHVCESVNGNMPADGLLDHFSVDHNSPVKEDQTFRLSQLKRSRKWTSCERVLRNMHFYAEAFLLGTLLIVLAFAVVIAILSVKGKQDRHLLVPT